MYPNNIKLSLTFLVFFLITNVFGTPGASSLAKNQTSTTEINRKIGIPEIRKFLNKKRTENNTIALGFNEPSDDPEFGELEFFFSHGFCFDLIFELFSIYVLYPFR